MKSSGALIATVTVFLLAVVAAVVAFWLIGSDNEDISDTDPHSQHAHEDRTHSSNFRPSDELENEMLQAAERLIRSNNDIIKLYITRGLPTKPEPYGNRPENNAYTVDSEEYKTLEDIDNFVDSIFTPDEAKRVKENMLDDGSEYYSNFGVIYVDKYGKLGINADFANFVPYDEFPVDWSHPSYTLKPISEDEAFLAIQLAIDGVDVIYERTMYKQDGDWLLDELILY